MDAVKLGLVCIFGISVIIGLAGLAFTSGDKAIEIALAAMNGASLIGGWLGHAMLTKEKGDVPPGSNL